MQPQRLRQKTLLGANRRTLSGRSILSRRNILSREHTPTREHMPIRVHILKQVATPMIMLSDDLLLINVPPNDGWLLQHPTTNNS